MSDIDFLGNKKNDKEEKSGAGKAEPEVVWSEPEPRAGGGKASAFSHLPFFSKKKPAAAAAKPELAIDQNKIKQSRREILELIKNSAGRASAGKSKVRKNLFASLSKKFAKQPDRRQIMIDYQQVFNREKTGKNRGGETLPAASGRPPADKAGGIQPVKPLKISVAAWLSKLKKFFGPKERPLQEKKPAPKAEVKPAEKPAGPEPKPKPGEPALREVLETNLIKGEIITFFDWRKKIMIFIGAISAASLVVAFMYLALIYYQKQNLAKNQEQAQKFEDIAGKINQESKELEKITDFQARLKLVSQIFSQHLYWTNFFKFLEDNTIKDVYYASFDGDTGGHYSLDALAEKFGNISEQINVLRNNEKITSVKTLGGDLMPGDEKNKTKVKFTLEFSILKKIFTE